ncbi:XTP/dITP diphosphatase [Geosporobacter ferrireducens]|uniref:dITP/XTP pyrophosphatase n=1 Tax=Geosporobacter ferrireducens TaxID=1424294 RepID=A0A1D8GFV7_9FIRM|nr:XTP/dITP diphosphatase [Geosporobacter ferrireducens]AOT69786.1 non-canonical purine NTP pyrophosphatase, RdgB/HAM1 family [Geosporobacter ferrireducens]MTI54501.1 XTP/dITP diphosphatase [Geosporobacter ferrireducens]
MKNKLVIASKNKHKIEEIKDILSAFNFNILSMDEAGLTNLDVVEDGETFEENSMKKADAVMMVTNCIALADDSGLEVDILDNQPGVYSARFSGEGANDQKNNEKLLERLQEVPMDKRQGRFVSVISLAFPDGRKVSVRGECSGMIGFEPKGDHGFGYDPLFIVPEYGKTFAELGEEIKNKISHRAKALEKLQEELKQIVGGKLREDRNHQ